MNIQLPQRNPGSARSLAGKVAIVTGSTSGIGLGIARSLAERGAAIVLNGFGKPDEIAATVKSFADIGVKAMHSAADMSKPESIAAMMKMTLDSLGRIDILVNNAGIQFVSPIDTFPVEKWDSILAINLSSAFHTTRWALPAMRKQGGGRIINVASAHGLVASPYKAAYVSAKHAVVGLTKTVALEIARTPVTCNAICPGFVRTPLAEAQVKPLAETALLMASLPPHVNMLEAIVLPVEQLYVGRG